MANNKFGGDFVIENSKITELSAQKKSFAGTDSVQIPFSVGVGPGHRSRGIPYFCTTSNPTSVFPTSKQSRSVTPPIVYYTFEAKVGSSILNVATDGDTNLIALLENDADINTGQKVRGSKSLLVSTDATNDYLNLDNLISTVQDMATGSITFWVYQTSDGTRMYYHASDHSDSGASEIEFYSSKADNNIRYIVKEGVGEVTVLDLSFLDVDGMDLNEWNHLAMTTGAGGTKLYLNGELKASSTTRAFFSDVSDISRIRIGADDAENDDYQGYIDEFAIWDVELNSTIIEAMGSDKDNAPDLNTVCGLVRPEYQLRNGTELKID
jgi:hypothetical protein